MTALLKSDRIPAVLVLADGTQFSGNSIGAEGFSAGEVVFNTAMTGYQEILTDPSYCRQIVTLTYPHIGNTGTNSEDEEAPHIHAAGLVVRDLPLQASSFRNEESLSDYLVRHNTVAIADVDTRKLTRHLRNTGAQGGCIVASANPDVQRAVTLAKDFAGLAGVDLACEVTCKKPYSWDQPTWRLQVSDESNPPTALTDPEGVGNSPYHVVAVDYGVKRNILRMLVDRGCRVTVVPAQTSSEAILALQPDGVFLSNGPGDPEPCGYAIAAIAEILETSLPVFGICLGHQLLALASGARTQKMKFGHHGANHPVQEVSSGRVMISSQNHGFAVDPDSLGNTLQSTHVSLFDGSLQGIQRTDKRAFGFQGHPEASPGPHDAGALFDQFVANISAFKADSAHA